MGNIQECKVNRACKLLWTIMGAVILLFCSVSAINLEQVKTATTKADEVKTELEVHNAGQTQWQKNVNEKLDEIKNDVKEIKSRNH
jgi:hypothetical protein